MQGLWRSREDNQAMASKGKILVVDDDRLVLAMVTHGLSQAGYEVIDADNGDDAILLARQHRPDIALLDIRMEGKTGFDVAQYLREVGHTPFVFLSAFSDEKTVAQVKALGALAYLVKPLEVGQIVPTIDAAFARAQEIRQAAEAQERADAAANSAGDTATAPLDEAATLAAVVPLAVGVLMHRFSLNRADALARLRKAAAAEGRSIATQAERLVSAVEELSGTRDTAA
jgi:response regulator NasT